MIRPLNENDRDAIYKGFFGVLVIGYTMLLIHRSNFNLKLKSLT
jgi:hypothetical protein